LYHPSEEESMQYKKLGDSGVAVSEIVFGAWAIGGWMWGGADRNDAVGAIRTAVDLGMTSIDTAPAYGFGLSEEIVGESLSGIRDRVQILSKYGLVWDRTEGTFFFETQNREGKPANIHRYAAKESVIRECEESLRRLDTDYIDLYQIHWPDPVTPIAETMEAVQKLLDEGKIRAAGVCNFSVEEMAQARAVAPVVSNQVEYSMVNRGIEDDIVPYCIENYVDILAYSPLQRGILTGKVTLDYTFNEGDHRPSTPYYSPQNRKKILELLQKIRPIASDHNATLAQLVIQWTIKRPGITAVLVGARNKGQVEENVRGSEFTLGDEEMERITGYLNQLVLDV
jgi:aryl-alcohol dehydrogenase-like predicted oxidoreductase